MVTRNSVRLMVLLIIIGLLVPFDGTGIAQTEMCPMPNTHQEGDKCVCNQGMKFYQGRCMTEAEFCGTFAHTYFSGGECRCDEGYIEDSVARACVPAPAVPVTQAAVATPTAAPTTAPTSAPAAGTAVDMVDVMIRLSDDESMDFSMEPIIEASMKDASQAEIQTVEKQKNAITVMLSLSSESTELPPTVDQKVTLIKEVIVEKVAQDRVKWEADVRTAEMLKKVKNKADESAYDDLMKREEGLLKSLEDNRISLEVMQKQSIQYMHNDQPFANTVWLGDKNYQESSKRDFMKETGGDPGDALVNVSQAISAQYELMGKIKDDIRAVREQRRSLLDVPAKPDPAEEMKKIKVDWYK